MLRKSLFLIHFKYPKYSMPFVWSINRFSKRDNRSPSLTKKGHQALGFSFLPPVWCCHTANDRELHESAIFCHLVEITLQISHDQSEFWTPAHKRITSRWWCQVLKDILSNHITLFCYFKALIFCFPWKFKPYKRANLMRNFVFVSYAMRVDHHKNI